MLELEAMDVRGGVQLSIVPTCILQETGCVDRAYGRADVYPRELQRDAYAVSGKAFPEHYGDQIGDSTETRDRDTSM